MIYRNSEYNGGNILCHYKSLQSRYYWRPVQKRRQEAQALVKEQQGQDSLEKIRATSSAATEERGTRMATKVGFEVDPRLLSFLEKDNSFLTPWNWNPNELENETSCASKEEKQHLQLQFQSGSFFPKEVFDFIYSKKSSTSIHL